MSRLPAWIPNAPYQVVETFAGLIHEQNRAGIMVTHDLRMCEFVDRVLQMQDGKLVNIYTGQEEITKFINRRAAPGNKISLKKQRP